MQCAAIAQIWENVGCNIALRQWPACIEVPVFRRQWSFNLIYLRFFKQLYQAYVAPLVASGEQIELGPMYVEQVVVQLVYIGARSQAFLP